MRNFVRIFQPIVHAKQLDAKQAVFSLLLRIRPVNWLSAKKPSFTLALPADKPSPQKLARDQDPPSSRRREPPAPDRSTRKPRQLFKSLAVDDENDFRSSSLRNLGSPAIPVALESPPRMYHN
jgi:hypothetical protein